MTTRQLSPEAIDLQAKIEDQQAQLHTLQDENQQLRRRQQAQFRFADLPLELRGLIWQHALPDARVLRVSLIPAKWDSNGRYDPAIFIFCSARPPALLHACRESREAALAQFKPFFEGDGSRPVYFRPKFDVLYLDMTAVLFFAALYPEVNEIESIAVPSDIPNALLGDEASNLRYLRGMKRLLLVTPLESPEPISQCCTSVEFSPDGTGRQQASEWEKFMNDRRPSLCNALHVEAVVGKLVCQNSYPVWTKPNLLGRGEAADLSSVSQLPEEGRS
ncbi:hypothetical protein CcaCcLH18_01959 [Colletotrichum camelliae]|nr:hypothetical protein CcaCcLH18_01959 [Colletotrichum camelliae]